MQDIIQRQSLAYQSAPSPPWVCWLQGISSNAPAHGRYSRLQHEISPYPFSIQHFPTSHQLLCVTKLLSQTTTTCTDRWPIPAVYRYDTPATPNGHATDL